MASRLLRARRDVRPALPDPVASPVIKWVGGKTKLLPELTARMPDRFERYYEPFVGGAALFFRVAPERAVLGDANADLIACYGAIATDVGEVTRHLICHADRHGAARFAEVKRAWNERSASFTAAEVAAMFVYLNKAGFNGLYRVNAKGEFNVGYGKRATYEPDLEALELAAAALRRADLRAGDYRETLRDAEPGDFIYIDPPYDATFASYTASKHGSGADDQADLAFEVRTLARRGVKVMVSSSDTPRIRTLYAGLRIDVVQAARAINCDGAGRGKVDELIITAGYAPDESQLALLRAERMAIAMSKRKRGGRP
jgi:DNA adenine methylase